MRTRLFLTCLALAFAGLINGQEVNVDVNLNINHRVDTITTFDRNKFVVMHGDVIEPEWGNYGGTNAIADVRDDFLNGYDVYLGRNSGPATNAITNATQNPSKPGYALESSIQSLGNSFKTYYDATDKLYASRNNIVSVAQITTWPFNNTDYTKFIYSQTDTDSEPFGTATGEALSHYLTYYYGGSGQPKPEYFEIINEPLYDLIIKHPNESDPETVFKYHRTIAQVIKNDHPDVKLGGYCVAFPNFDDSNFSRWEDRWKMFVDTAGAYMDFWSIHLYDFPTVGGKELYRKGSNMEATFDMLDQYSMLELGHTKPYVVSEFGASVHDYQGAWSPYRDWLHMKSVNSMMMQFMERPDMIGKAVNFLIAKATWGTAGVDNTYPHRLMRMADEPASLSGNWIYSDMVKTYQLWQDVNGKRVDSYSTDLDILVDAYVEGDKAYVILNSLELEDGKTININLKETTGITPSSLLVRNMYLDDSDAQKDNNSSILTADTYSSNIPTQFTLKPEATIILQYTLSGTVNVGGLLTEEKYFSDDYYKAITADTEYTFNIDGVTQGGTYNETILRLGIGRAHSLSKTPVITVNGTEVEVPANHRGGDQKDRAVFFGVLEIPVPNHLIATDNVVKVKFADDGGYISSVTMQNYVFDTKPFRSSAVSNVEVYPPSLSIGVGQDRVLTAIVIPDYAVDKRVTWSSDNANVSVSSDGVITGEIAGTSATITATTSEGGLTSTCNVTVEASRVPVLVDKIIVTPATADLIETKTLQLSYEALPVDADDKSITWTTSNGNATVIDGLVTAVSEGMVEIQALGTNGVVGVCSLNVIKRIPGKIEVPGESNYAIVQEGVSLYVEANVTASTGTTIQTMRFSLDILDSNGGFVKGYTSYDNNVLDKESGIASVTLGTRRAIASANLPEGQYYVLEITMTESDGNVVVKTIPVVVGDDTGIEDDLAVSVFIYPNPATDFLNISGLLNDVYSVSIYSTQGAIVKNIELDYSAEQQVDISELPQGIYMLKISGENISKTFLLRK